MKKAVGHLTKYKTIASSDICLINGIFKKDSHSLAVNEVNNKKLIYKSIENCNKIKEM